MTAIAWYSLGDDLFLQVTRALIVSYSTGAAICLARWAFENRYSKRPIFVFASGWHTVLATLSGYILFSGHTIRPPLWTAIYGSAFLGSLVGLFWIILGYRDALVKEPRCNSLCANHEVVVQALKKAAEEVAAQAVSLDRASKQQQG